MEELVYYVWLARLCGAGSRLGSYLCMKFGTPENVYNASFDELVAKGVSGAKAEEIISARGLDNDKRTVELCGKANIKLITKNDREYPERLCDIHTPPLLLYCKGRMPEWEDRLFVAAVGTRNCTERGKKLAYEFGFGLAAGGAVPVSGLALGIDSAVATGALDAGKSTVAVLGSGIDRPYPPQNRKLFDRICETGAVITEYAPGTEPSRFNFPVRNRIISGLCEGTVVIEAAKESGSMITAKQALMQGRDVFAVPGETDDRENSGANTLIESGARAVYGARDILSFYAREYPLSVFPERLEGVYKKEPDSAVLSKINVSKHSEKNREKSADAL